MHKNNNKPKNVPLAKRSGSVKMLTWKEIVRLSVVALNTRSAWSVSLEELESFIRSHPRARGATKETIHKNILRTLQSEEYVQVGRDVWALSWRFSEEELAALRDLSKTSYPTFVKRS